MTEARPIGAASPRDRRIQALASTIAIAVPLAFLAVGVIRAYPFLDDVRLPAVRPDDWHTYKRLAVSILQGGLSMPGVSSSYTHLPHGFLYIYFLALVFALTGINTAYVYLVQALIAGLSVSLTYAAVRRQLTVIGGLGFLLALTALTYVDVLRHLSFKLLSENLYFLVSPPLFIFLFRSVEGRGHERRDAFLAGAMLGLVVLARPSFTGSAAAVVAVLAIAAAMRRITVWPAVFLMAGFGVAVSFVALRNYVAVGRPSFDLITDPFDWLRLWELPLREAAASLITRTLFVLGWTHTIAPAYRVRLYWTLLWLLWLAFPVMRSRSGRGLALSDWLAYAYVIGYIVPVLFIAGDIGSYGGRMVIVVLPLLVVAAFRLFSGVDVRPESGSRSEIAAVYVRN